MATRLITTWTIFAILAHGSWAYAQTCSERIANLSYGISIDMQGNVWVSQHKTGKLRKYDQNGVLGTNTFDMPATFNKGVAVTPADDNVWVAHEGFDGLDNRVTRYDNTGNLCETITLHGFAPSGLAVDADGNVWVTNRRDKEGETEFPALERITPVDEANTTGCGIGSEASSSVPYDIDHLDDASVQPMVALERPTYAQEPVPRDEACAQPIYEPILWKPFIDGSLRAVQEGADRQLVLETLECIAIQDRTAYGIGGVALFAMVHLSKDDPELKDRLLRIIVSENTFPTARGTACWLIRFVANATVERELLSYMKNRWGTKEADEVFIALIELGSRGFLQFVEKCAAAPQERLWMKGRCEQLLPQLRAGQTLEGALRLLRTSVENDTIDWAWVVRRAARLGASKDQLRTAALAFLRSSREAGRDKFALGVLSQGMDKKYGFLTAADALEFPMSSSAVTIHDIGLPEDNPVWATHYKELRRALFRRDLGN